VSMVRSPTPQYAVLSARTVPHGKRLVLAYRDEKNRRDLPAAPSIAAPGYGSREERQASIDRHTAAAHPPQRKLTVKLAVNGSRSLRELVANHPVIER